VGLEGKAKAAAVTTLAVIAMIAAKMTTLET